MTCNDRPVLENRDEIAWELAQRLYEQMERHDPSDAPPWEGASEWERHYFRSLVIDVIDRYEWLMAHQRSATTTL